MNLILKISENLVKNSTLRPKCAREKKCRDKNSTQRRKDAKAQRNKKHYKIQWVFILRIIKNFNISDNPCTELRNIFYFFAPLR